MPSRLLLCLLACLLVPAQNAFPVAAGPDWRLEMGERVGPEESAALREEVREMVWTACLSTPPLSSHLWTSLRQFHFTYDNYMRHAFPKDELKPLSCTGTVRYSSLLAAGSRLIPSARTRWAVTPSRSWMHWTLSH